MDMLKLRVAHDRMDDLQRTADEIRMARTLRHVDDEADRVASVLPRSRPTPEPARRTSGCQDDLGHPRPA